MAEQAENSPMVVEPTPLATARSKQPPQPQAPDQEAVAEQIQLTTRAAELANEVATTSGATRAEAEAELEGVANRAQTGPDAGRAAYADNLRDEARTELDDGAPAAAQRRPADSAGELQIKWTQKGDEVAPLLEMRAYLDQFKEEGVAVGALKFEREIDGKLSGGFGVSYDPAGAGLLQMEGAVQGLKRVGNGLEVTEAPEQVATRRRTIGVAGQDQATDVGYSVKEAFGPKQWDALSAQLSQVPRSALTLPEQAQQAAGMEHVKQVAQEQGKKTEQVVQEGKSLLAIDTSGNPVSAFLKNFYDHLNGGAKTRQIVEADYEETRQPLQARLNRQAGTMAADGSLDQEQGQRPEAPAAVVEPAVSRVAGAAVVPEPAAPVAAQPHGAPKFTEADVPEKLLASMGLTLAELRTSGQLQKLLNGEKTDLLALKAGGADGQEPVNFKAKLVLQREANGTAALKMELPKQQLDIPNEIGGQAFTPEQRQRLETEGSAGLIRGLKDAQGNSYNGYVGVDKEMNKVVVLPENKVTFKDTIAGVRLSPEQSHDLREGKAVKLAQMSRVDGGKPFDGIVQLQPAKAGVQVKPEPYELAHKQAPKATQQRDLEAEKESVEKAKARSPRI